MKTQVFAISTPNPETFRLSPDQIARMRRRKEEKLMNQTVMAAKLAEKGITARNVKFQMALAEFRNNGGRYEEALAMLRAAYGKDGGKGHGGYADKAIGPSPISSSRGEGHQRRAAVANKDLPSPRKPGHARRGAAAVGATEAALAKSLFDTVTLPDGRRLREVAWAECPALATRYRRLSRILMAIHARGIPADPAATLDNILGEADLKQIIEAVERFNDIH